MNDANAETPDDPNSRGFLGKEIRAPQPSKAFGIVDGEAHCAGAGNSTWRAVIRLVPFDP
jgi:hypothetical protein